MFWECTKFSMNKIGPSSLSCGTPEVKCFLILKNTYTFFDFKKYSSNLNFKKFVRGGCGQNVPIFVAVCFLFYDSCR